MPISANLIAANIPDIPLPIINTSKSEILSRKDFTFGLISFLMLISFSIIETYAGEIFSPTI